MDGGISSGKSRKPNASDMKERVQHPDRLCALLFAVCVKVIYIMQGALIGRTWVSVKLYNKLITNKLYRD